MHKSIATILTRRAAMTGAVVLPVAAISAAAIVASPSAALTQAPDPVLLLIECWKEATRYCDKLGEIEADDGVINEANDVVNAIADQLAATAPTTPEGLARYLDFVRKHFNTGEHSGWADNLDLKAADTAVAAAFVIAGLTPQASQQPRQDLTDAEVVRLREEINAAPESEGLRLIDELNKTNAPAVIRRALDKAMAQGVSS